MALFILVLWSGECVFYIRNDLSFALCERELLYHEMLRSLDSRYTMRV